jgi:hypothetical protein
MLTCWQSSLQAPSRLVASHALLIVIVIVHASRSAIAVVVHGVSLPPKAFGKLSVRGAGRAAAGNYCKGLPISIMTFASSHFRREALDGSEMAGLLPV